MKNKCLNKKSLLSLLVMLALLAAMALTFTACDDDVLPSEESTKTTETSSELKKIEFTVEVTKADGTTKTFTVTSDQENLGDALVEEGLIQGEEGTYGWYITTVDGEFHKYEEDGKYWALYIDGEYAMSGVSSTSITEGTVYSFKAES